MSRSWARVLSGLSAISFVACSPSSTTAPPTDETSDTDDGANPDDSPPPVDTDGTTALTLTSAAFTDAGTLPSDYTCDGAGTSPPLAWFGAPADTGEYALLMTTLAPDGLKWNWVLYGIPADTSSLTAAATDVGTFGLTSDGPNLAYSPPCSQGPGEKFYTLTLYALSDSPALPSDPHQVNGPVLTEALAPVTLATSALTVSYTRP